MDAEAAVVGQAAPDQHTVFLTISHRNREGKTKIGENKNEKRSLQYLHDY